MTQEQYETLKQLHDDVWTEDLLGGDFQYIFDRILNQAEREITIMRIDGWTVYKIAQYWKVRQKTIKRMVEEIEFKYRTGAGRKVRGIMFKKYNGRLGRRK